MSSKKGTAIFELATVFFLSVFITTSLYAENGEVFFEKVNSLSSDDKTVSHIFSKALTGKELKQWHSEIDALISYGILSGKNPKITKFISSYPLFEYLDRITPGSIRRGNGSTDYSIIAAWRVHEYVDYVLIPRIVESMRHGRFEEAKQTITKLFILFPPESRYCHFSIIALSRIFPNAVLYSRVDDDFLEWLKEMVSVYFSALTKGEARACFITRLLLFNIYLAKYHCKYGHWPQKIDISGNAFVVDYKTFGDSYCYMAQTALPNGDILYGASKKDVSNTILPNTTEIIIDRNRLRILERLKSGNN